MPHHLTTDPRIEVSADQLEAFAAEHGGNIEFDNAAGTAHWDHPNLPVRYVARVSKTEAVKPPSPYWHGMLCAETREDIVQRMRSVLDDNFFTVVTANSYSETNVLFRNVDVLTSQRLVGVGVKTHRDEEFSHVTWAVSRLCMGVLTAAETQAEARDGGKTTYVYFTFKPGQFAIEHYAPAGYRLLWQFVVEDHDVEEAAR